MRPDQASVLSLSSSLVGEHHSVDTTLLEHDCMTMLGLKESALGTLLYMAADE